MGKNKKEFSNHKVLQQTQHTKIINHIHVDAKHRVVLQTQQTETMEMAEVTRQNTQALEKNTKMILYSVIVLILLTVIEIGFTVYELFSN